MKALAKGDGNLPDHQSILAQPKQLARSMLRCHVIEGEAEALVFTFGGVGFSVPWKDIV